MREEGEMPSYSQLDRTLERGSSAAVLCSELLLLHAGASGLTT